MKKLIIALLFLISIAGAYTNSPITMPGYNQYGYDTNLRGWAIWNGTLNGTNFQACNISNQASVWNGSWLSCVTSGDAFVSDQGTWSVNHSNSTTYWAGLNAPNLSWDLWNIDKPSYATTTYVNNSNSSMQGYVNASDILKLNKTDLNTTVNFTRGNFSNLSVFYPNSSLNHPGAQCAGCHAAVTNVTVDKNLSNYTNTPGFVTNATMANDNTKLNITGGNVTALNITVNSMSYDYGIGIASTGGYKVYNNSNIITDLSNTGKQWWMVGATTTGIKNGYIAYGTPGGAPGISYYTANYPNYPYGRADIYTLAASGGTVFLNRYWNETGIQSAANLISFDNTGNITVSQLAGSGNAPALIDSTGKLYVNRSAGAGLPLTSPDGSSWCIKISDLGIISETNMTLTGGTC